jgi:hypothetical protein
MLKVTKNTTNYEMKKQKNKKMKKNANEFVDIEKERQNDPKYKTELCKSWMDTNFCVYGNKCRFAHGRHELSCKTINQNKYKQKSCQNFAEQGHCIYGTRCNFIHDERRFKDLNRSYYTYLLYAADRSFNYPLCGLSFISSQKRNINRLGVFQDIISLKSDKNSLSNSNGSTTGSPQSHFSMLGRNCGRIDMIPNSSSFEPLFTRLN